MSGRVALISNSLWLFAWADRTISVLDPGRDLNIHNVPNNIGQWRQVGRVGSQPKSTHRELEIFGVVLSGRQLEELSTEIINHQLIVNREGLMIMYFNVGARNMYLIYPGKPTISLIRRLNDLFDWSKYGVRSRIETGWDRFQLNTGRLMVDKWGSGMKERENQTLKVQLKEKEKEIQKLKEQLKHKDGHIRNQKQREMQKQNEKLNKQLKENDDRIQKLNNTIAELKSKHDGGDSVELRKLRDTVTTKDKRIKSLKIALRAMMDDD